MTEISDLSDTDATNTAIGGESLDGNIANMGRMDNTLQVVMGMLSRWRNSGLFRLRDSTDQTRLWAIDLSPLTTATTRTLIVPDENGRLALAPHLSGYLYGLMVANNATDANNDIDIGTGVAIDSANTHVMTLASALVKRIDAAWAVGTNQGMLDGTESVAGTPDVSTWYHIYLIKRVDTGVVDVLASESVSAPTMPTNYTLKRRIFSVFNDGSGNIQQFKHDRGDRVVWATTDVIVNVSVPDTNAHSENVESPNGIKCDVELGIYIQDNTAAVATTMLITDPDTTDEAPSTTAFDLQMPAASGAGLMSGQIWKTVRTNTTRSIRYRVSQAPGDSTLRIVCKAYIDPRKEGV